MKFSIFTFPKNAHAKVNKKLRTVVHYGSNTGGE